VTSIEQTRSEWFGRWSWTDGKTESWRFPIDASLSLVASIKGTRMGAGPTNVSDRAARSHARYPRTIATSSAAGGLGGA